MEIPREELRKKINPFINFCGFDDSLSYLRETIKGMNLPQFYIKEKGVWTGGHEENCRIRSININHGPQGSEWYGIRSEDAKTFSDYLKKKHNFDIYVKEGLWYEEWEYFLKNKINVLYTIQKESDIILVGPGCIHWVRSLGFATHSSWNFFHKEKKAFEIALDRFNINKTIPMRSLVPIFNLMIDILNFEMYYLDIDLVKFCYEKLKDIHYESSKELKNILNNPKYFKIQLLKEESHLVVCELCYEELFNFWSYADFSKKREKFDAIMCSKCFEKEFNNFDLNSPITIGYKYEIDELDKLLRRVEKRISIEEKNEVDWDYENEFQPSLVKINSDTVFNCKIKMEFIQRNLKDIESGKLTNFLNKKNKIFEKISPLVVMEDIKKNFEFVVKNEKLEYDSSITSQINKIFYKRIKNVLLGGFNCENNFEEKNENENFLENSPANNFIKYLDRTKLQLVEEEFVNCSTYSLNENSLNFGKKDNNEKINKGKNYKK